MNLILNTIPKEPVLTTRPDQGDVVKYGEYLTNAASCLDCHTPENRGKLKMELAFAGGREFKLPGGVLKSLNITPDKETGIGTWTREDFIRRFKAYSDESSLASVGEQEYNSIMPWVMYADMDEKDLSAIYDYLQSLSPINNKVVFWEN